MTDQHRRTSPVLAAFWEALGLTILLFLVFSLTDGIGMRWLVAGALLVVFLAGWGLLYLANRFGSHNGEKLPRD